MSERLSPAPVPTKAAVSHSDLKVTVFYVLLGLIDVGLIGSSLISFGRPIQRPWLFAYLLLLNTILGMVVVRIERGALNLSAIPTYAAALMLTPADAAIIASASSAVGVWRGHWRSPTYAFLGPTLWTAAGSWAYALALRNGAASVAAIVIGIATLVGINWVATGLTVMAKTGESPRTVYRKNFTPSWYAAFVYFGLAATLIKDVVDGSTKGYVLGAIVCALSLALSDTISGRQQRAILEAQLTDADRHLVFSRLVEGVVHNLRNHVWAIQGYLREIDLARLNPENRHDIEIASAAATDAATSLRNLSTGATPRVRWNSEPLDTNELVRHAVALVHTQARDKGVHVRTEESSEQLRVSGDPLLLREVITNLLLNAIDAVPKGGRVTVTTGTMNAGSLFIRVADNGPGVPEELRQRLFEPHFTTKPDGTGVGLFTAYGIVREHRGTLLYEGTPRRGAVFTVVLPQAAPGPLEPARQDRPA